MLLSFRSSEIASRFVFSALFATLAISLSAVPLRAAQLPGATSVTAAAASTTENAEDHDIDYASFPIIRGYYKGRVALYISTDVSNASVAASNHLNYVPRLAGAVVGGAVDDIYQFTNFNQGNVIPSAPTPAGAANGNASYSPLWQLSLVTWKAGTHPQKLRSEEAILKAKADGLVAIAKTNIVINCPVFYTPQGGVLRGVHYSR